MPSSRRDKGRQLEYLGVRVVQPGNREQQGEDVQAHRVLDHLVPQQCRRDDPRGQLRTRHLERNEQGAEREYDERESQRDDRLEKRPRSVHAEAGQVPGDPGVDEAQHAVGHALGNDGQDRNDPQGRTQVTGGPVEPVPPQVLAEPAADPKQGGLRCIWSPLRAHRTRPVASSRHLRSASPPGTALDYPTTGRRSHLCSRATEHTRHDNAERPLAR